jgi:monoamine oxidase
MALTSRPKLGPSLREPVGRIRWAGTETAERTPDFLRERRLG